jgi:hypothetical protein
LLGADWGADADDSWRAGRDAEEQDEEIYGGGYSAEVQEGISGEMSGDTMDSEQYVTHGLGRSSSLDDDRLWALIYPLVSSHYDFYYTIL